MKNSSNLSEYFVNQPSKCQIHLHHFHVWASYVIARWPSFCGQMVIATSIATKAWQTIPQIGITPWWAIYQCHYCLFNQQLIMFFTFSNEIIVPLLHNTILTWVMNVCSEEELKAECNNSHIFIISKWWMNHHWVGWRLCILRGAFIFIVIMIVINWVLAAYFLWVSSLDGELITK